MRSRRRTKLLSAKLRRILVVTLTLLALLAGALGVPTLQAPARAASVETPPTEAKPQLKPKRCCCCPVDACSEGCCCAPQDALPVPSEPAPPQVDAAKFGVKWVLGVSARKCRGESQSWTTLEPSAPPAAWSTWDYSWVFVSWLSASHYVGSVKSNPPPSPPPRS